MTRKDDTSKTADLFDDGFADCITAASDELEKAVSILIDRDEDVRKRNRRLQKSILSLPDLVTPEEGVEITKLIDRFEKVNGGTPFPSPYRSLPAPSPVNAQYPALTGFSMDALRRTIEAAMKAEGVSDDVKNALQAVIAAMSKMQKAIQDPDGALNDLIGGLVTKDMFEKNMSVIASAMKNIASQAGLNVSATKQEGEEEDKEDEDHEGESEEDKAKREAEEKKKADEKKAEDEAKAKKEQEEKEKKEQEEKDKASEAA